MMRSVALASALLLSGCLADFPAVSIGDAGDSLARDALDEKCIEIRTEALEIDAQIMAIETGWHGVIRQSPTSRAS